MLNCLGITAIRTKKFLDYSQINAVNRIDAAPTVSYTVHMNITKQELAKLIRNQKNTGHIFTVTFVKKDGSVRTMNARLGVKKHWTTPDGSGGKYSPQEHALICVFDCQKEEYRSINEKTLLSAKIGGVEYEVSE